MIKGLHSPAFTIVEVMIVLAVTAAILLSALLMIGHQQENTEFIQAVHEAQSQIDDVINNVNSGYYASRQNFECQSSLSGPVVDDSSSNTRGTNKDCIIIGRTMHFAVN